jgi:hypothetical protein
MTYIVFCHEAVNYYVSVKTEQRFGQAVFNYLNKVRPDIADQIVDTEYDCFYKTFVDDAVWNRIESLWNATAS